MFLKPLSGAVFCERCVSRTGDELPLSVGALAAWRWVLSAPSDKVFSFRLGAESEGSLLAASERFLLTCLGRGFQTLDFYHAVT
jgi:DNA repair protein RecO (recombination protein O)